ncbi:transcriptional regulator, DeoR family [Nocardioides terrae]|uniref:Transcriptional regulator, DeoR family n=1 Tax=Nocardioides terrae TaxID=574651 RepID=A0A1I1F4U2_9ACTN|nr:DeoR/GlpR family DNA-binding transcription regulator [Nocardioides terrae]SFB92180.1 transcriptional regulator, DeoR family [Nocardioides terrae]
MLAEQRRRAILSELRRTGAVKVADLTDLLGVSEMTIRRDLEQLSTDGLAEKVHGGAVLGGSAIFEPGFAAKSQLAGPAKQAIAAAATAMVRPGSAIALSAGTTTWAMARLVAHVADLTVVTNSPSVADAVTSENPQATVILTGGVRTPSDALVGPIADRTIAGLHVDQLFLGVHGADLHEGLTTPNLAEAMTNKALIAAAREVVVVADSSKWGVVGFADIGPLSLAGTFVTDSALPRRAVAELREHVDSVVVAGA